MPLDRQSFIQVSVMNASSILLRKINSLTSFIFGRRDIAFDNIRLGTLARLFLLKSIAESDLFS